MKVIFSSGCVTDFLIRLCLTVIVSSPVIIWSWDTVKQTTGSDIIAAVFFITILGGLWLLLYGVLSLLIDLLKPAGENRTKRKERGGMKEENPKWPVIAIVAVFILFMTGMMCYGLIRDKREVLFHITNQFYGVNCEKSSGIAWVIKNDYRQDLTFHDYAVFCNDTGFSGKQIKTGHEIQINKDVIYNALSGNKHQK